MSSLSETMIIGLTGGIASGKSTVVEMIKEAGYKVIDADQLVHDMQAKGGRLYSALLDWLGEEILLPNGELNRPKLGQLIFSNEEMRHRSAEIQGTIIREELATQRDCLAKKEDDYLCQKELKSTDWQRNFKIAWIGTFFTGASFSYLGTLG